MRRWVVAVGVGAGLAWACQFDGTLRAYLSVSFWSPFLKTPAEFERAGVKRVDVAYAGMGPLSATPLGRLREAYRKISTPQAAEFDASTIKAAVDAARASVGLSGRDREEIQLIDAKIDIRLGDRRRRQPLTSAATKLDAFLNTAKTAEWLSEARGWKGYIHTLLGEQSAAGKIYVDELNRDGSNLSRETLLRSLSELYGQYGEQEMLAHLEEYFDTAEHAAFALQLATNPHANRGDESAYYKRAWELLQERQQLLAGNRELPLLMMRVALQMGDPEGAVRVGEMVPANASVRRDTDFLWMLAAGHFVSRDYAGAEAPLLAMFGALESDDPRRHAAAYGLCGVYDKTGNRVEQLRYALWLASHVYGEYGEFNGTYDGVAEARNFGVYWAFSGWDKNLLLEGQASLEDLRAFVERYPKVENVRAVKYAIAVRLAREDKYTESAAMYESIGQPVRMLRMRQLAKLWADGTNASKYAFAKVLSDHGNGVYYNDSLWDGFQRYALGAENDSRLTKDERERQIALERDLRDQQEEHWRAYKILREVMDAEGRNELGRKAGLLAQKNLRMIRTDRFGRQDEVAQLEREVSRWLEGR